MTVEGETTTTSEGTPPAGETNPEPKGTPPAGEGETTPPATPPEVDIEVDAATTPDPQGKAWENFRAKYPGMEEDAVKELFAEQWWEKNNYAKEQRERAERAERELEELREERKKAKAKPDEPKAPHPDVERVAKKIKTLMERDTGLYKEQETAAEAYNRANTEALKLEGRAEQAKAQGDEDAADRLSARADAAAAKAEAAKTNWRMIGSRRQELAERIDELVQEQQFVDDLSRTQEETEEQDRRETQEAIEAFPVWLDQQTVALAKEAGIPADKHTIGRVMVHVRKSMHYDLAQPQNANKDLRDMPLQQMVRNHIKDWATDHDIVARKKFKDTSDAKLKVTAPAGKTPPKADDKGTPQPPARPKGPVPASFLARGGEEIPESFKRGREYLRSKGLG
jgi:hypothetical protein